MNPATRSLRKEIVVADFDEADVAPANALTNYFIRSTHVHFAEREASNGEFRTLWRAGVDARPIYPWLAASEQHAQSGASQFLGYAKAGEFRSRSAYRRSVECAIYVVEPARGRGVGVALYAELLARLRVLGYHTAVAGIALPNEASVHLHERVGFTHVGTFREVGRKMDAWHDVGFWQVML